MNFCDIYNNNGNNKVGEKMLQIEKIFEKVTPKNHSIDGYTNNKIRIKDNTFSIKSIYKIAEHLKWMKEEIKTCDTKILIDSDYIAGQAILTLMESIIYFVMNEWNFKVMYRFSIKDNVLGYQIFKNSILFKYNNKKISIEDYNTEYNKQITVDMDHFRKLCRNNEENRKGKFISITMDEVDTFLKLFEFDDDYRNELAEVIVEIVDNALNHSNGDCILNLNVLKNSYHRYKYVDVALVVIDDIFIGKEIMEYIYKENKSEYSEKNKIVLEAYEKHKKFFDETYNIHSFAMISAFQKYVTTRKMSYTGGTGLTTLIKALIEKSNHNFCYAISGDTNMIFIKEFLKLNEEGLIGFNEENNYKEMPPNKKVVSVNKYDMNINIYNLQFVLKENEYGRQ